MHRLTHAFQNIDLLPTAPAILPTLLELLHNPNAGLDQVAKLVELEPSISLRVLKMCNAACFAHFGSTGNISEAISRLGFENLYMMVVAASGKSMLALAAPESNREIYNLWKHSVITSLAAEMIASDHEKDGSALFTAGLLHDFGKLIFAAAFKADYFGLLAEARGTSVNSAVLERKVYNLDHAQVGGQLLERWRFPQCLIDAVRDHHAPPA